MNVYALSPGSAFTSGKTFSDVSKSSVPLSGRWITSDFATCPPLRSNRTDGERIASCTERNECWPKRRENPTAGPGGRVYDRKRERHAHRCRDRRQRPDQGRPAGHVARATRQRARDRRGRARAARAGARGRAHARQRAARRRAAAAERARRAGGRAAAAGRPDRDDPGPDRLPARERLRRHRRVGPGRRAAHARARGSGRRRLREPDQARRAVLRRGRGAPPRGRAGLGRRARLPAAAGAASCPARTR